MERTPVTVKLTKAGLAAIDELRTGFGVHVNRSVVIRAALSVAMNHKSELRERLKRFEEV